MLTRNITVNSLHVSGRERGKESFVNMPEHSTLLNMVYLQEKLVNLLENLLGFSLSLFDIRRKIPNFNLCGVKTTTKQKPEIVVKFTV